MSLSEWLLGKQMVSPSRWLERYPPFRSMRIRVLELGDDWDRARILLPLNAHNANPGGSMFGGCMAALADPIAALACARRFPGHAVWTRTLSLDFQREGCADLELRFEFDAGIEQGIREELRTRGRSTPRFEYGFYLPDGLQCAKVENRVAIRPQGTVAASTGALRD